MEVGILFTPDQLRDLLTEAAKEGARLALSEVETGADDPLSIVPSRLYTQPRAAALLGFGHRPKTLSEIPEADLPRCKVGPARGSVRYLGCDLIAYAKGLPMPDTGALVEAARARLLRTLERPSPVRPSTPGARHRVR